MEVFILEMLIKTIKNFDFKIKKIMINGLYFALAISIIATLILTYYITYHSNFIFYIGIKVMQLAITFACAFFSSAFVIDRIKKDFLQ